jgi:hypothetical protein
MANASLGSLTFDSALGTPAGTGTVLEEIRRLGVDGVGYLICARYPDPWQLQTIDFFSSAANALAAFAGFKASQGMLATYTDGFSQSWGIQAIRNVVMSEPIQASVKFAGYSAHSAGNTPFRLSCVWTLQYAGS